MAQELEVRFQLPTGNDASTDSKFRDTDKIKDILLNGTASSHYDSNADGIGFKTVRTDTGATVSSSQGLANYSGFTSHFTFESFDSVIYGKPTDQNANYTVSTGILLIITLLGVAVVANSVMYLVFLSSTRMLPKCKVEIIPIFGLAFGIDPDQKNRVTWLLLLPFISLEFSVRIK